MPELRVLTWNLFHGRDHPPDPALLTWRSRLLRITERNDTHVQVNRELEREFAGVIAAADWDLALLQECPPRWIEPLARACDASAHAVLTSRNRLGAVRSALARANPDLIASNEGGCNLTLARTGELAERRELELRPGPRPERRAMAFTRLQLAAGELCVANLHASAGSVALAEADLRFAASQARDWAGAVPLVFGGDLNARPGESPVFGELADRFGLVGATGPAALDHLLSRGLKTLSAPRPWPPAGREVPEDGRALRLSDHAPVQATFEIVGATAASA